MHEHIPALARENGDAHAGNENACDEDMRLIERENGCQSAQTQNRNKQGDIMHTTCRHGARRCAAGGGKRLRAYTAHAAYAREEAGLNGEPGDERRQEIPLFCREVYWGPKALHAERLNKVERQQRAEPPGDAPAHGGHAVAARRIRLAVRRRFADHICAGIRYSTLQRLRIEWRFRKPDDGNGRANIYRNLLNAGSFLEDGFNASRT